MAVTKTVNVETTNARASTTLTDTTPTVPLPDTPQGLMVIGPQVTLHFVKDAWNKANSYDYYDVVQVDGTSYIAVQDVPANTEITNTTYWAKWNDPNAQLKLLQDTVGMMDGRIDAVEEAVTEATTQINSLIANNCVINIESYGCASEADDNSANLQSAINANIGKILYIPGKTYTCATPIEVPPGTTLMGCGYQSCLKFTSKQGFHAKSDEKRKRISQCFMTNFKISGPNTGTLSSGEHENAGIYGMFMGSYFNNMFIEGFEYGVYLFQEVDNPEYNQYLFKYGDFRVFHNIFLHNGYVGFRSDENDVMCDGLVIVGYKSPLEISGNCRNVHVYGCRSGIQLGTGNYTNIEVESQYLSNGDTGNSDPFVWLTGSANITNLNLWNAMNLDNIGSNFCHGYIRFVDSAKNATASVHGLYIGDDVKNPTKLKKYVFSSQTAASNNYIFIEGRISNKIKELNTGYNGAPVQLCSNVENFASVIAMVTASFALKGAINISTPIGFNKVDYTHGVS